MNEKDLFKGLNHLDDEIIDEAAKPDNELKKQGRRNCFWSNIHTIGTVAAVAAVFVLGWKVVSLNNTLEKTGMPYSNGNGTEMAEKTDSAEAGSAGADYIGVADGKNLGDMFTVARGYDDLYDHLETIESEKDKEYLEYYDTNNVEAEGEMTDSASASDRDTAVIEDYEAPNAQEPTNEKSDYSKTNVMTEGVDESDIVKTDGKYIYMVESSWISITDISKGKPGERKAFSPEFDSPADVVKEMYVDDGRMFLVVSHIKKQTDEFYDMDEETVCYSYDIADPQNPKLIGKMRQDGSYNTSRKVGDTVYLFTMQTINRPDIDKDKAIAEDALGSWIPSVNDMPVDSGCIYMGNQGQNGILISSFDIKEPDKTIDSKYVMSGYCDIYVSNDAIYFYENDWKSGRTITSISKMFYKDGKISAGQSTMINGMIYDSFAISQQNGYLYVIATEDSSDVSVNTLHVFDSDMKQTGVINEIARDERIYAARFLGDYAYFITYRQIDPLFVADISDPANPKLLGELEVEGFSEYLHIWDENHVLGIGYITKENARDRIRLTMFDVSDPKNPVEENSYVLNESDYCDALQGNYKAILADPKKNLIGFAAGDNYSLFKYDKKNGFSLIRDTKMKYDNSGGYRGLYSGDNFYVAGNGEIEYFSLK